MVFTDLRALFHFRFFLSVALALGLSTSGCSKGEPDMAAHWSAARKYLEAEDYDKAIIELRNIIQLDPADDEAHYKLGKAYLHTLRLQDAFNTFRRATLLAPENLEAQFQLGRMYFLAGDAYNAEEKAELILARSPDHLEALGLLADIQALQKETGAAVKTLERLISLDPENAHRRISLARLYLERGDWEKADTAFMEAADLDSVFLPLIRRGSSEAYQSLPVLARYYESRGMGARAQKAYEKAAEAAIEHDVSALLDLALFHARARSYQESLDALDRAMALRQDDLDIMANKAEILLAAGDPDSAEQVVDDILDQYRSHVGATFLKGKMALSRGRPDQALTRFKNVTRAKPGFAPAHYYEGLTLLRLEQTHPARERLETAVRLDPDQLHARLLLADSYIREYRRGDATFASGHLDYVLNRFPQNREALTLLGNLGIRTNDYSGAEEVFQRLINLYPDDAHARFRLGFVYYLMERDDDAVIRFKEALDLDPGQRRALILAVNLLVKHGRHQEALALCEDIAPKVSENRTALAVVQNAKARVYMELGEEAEAEKHILSAIQNDPDLLSPHALLIQLYMRSKRVNQIVLHFDKALEENPEFLAGYMALGMIHDASGEMPKANNYYRQALRIRPGFAPAANNLAWNLASTGNDLDEAFRLARTALAGMPDDPHVLDTMGWIHYLLGHHWRAVTELERAVAQEPNAPALHFRLGKAYLAAGDPESGRLSMERALALSRDFPDAEEAVRVLRDMEENSKNRDAG